MTRDELRSTALQGLQKLLNAPHFLTHLTDEQRQTARAAQQVLTTRADLADPLLDAVVALAPTLNP